jgi:hypothetical protein
MTVLAAVIRCFRHKAAKQENPAPGGNYGWRQRSSTASSCSTVIWPATYFARACAISISAPLLPSMYCGSTEPNDVTSTHSSLGWGRYDVIAGSLRVAAA